MVRTLLISLLFLGTSLHAAVYPPSYRWRTITTEHFLIHHHQGEEELAVRAAAIAESVHTRLVPLVGWEPAERTHLILSDHVDVSNGSATPFPNNRMEIYVSAPGSDPTSPLAYYDDWLDLVITHEYAHILHLDQVRRSTRALRRILGRHPATFPNAASPLWLTEGFATWIESELTESGRGKGTFVDMVLRTAAVEERWPTLGQAAGLTPFWPGGSSRYFFGSKFLGWVAERHGSEQLTRFLREYSGNIIPYLVNRTARKVFGTSMTKLWNEWSVEQRAEYRATVDRIRADGLTPVTRVTELGYETKHPILSPDARRIAYTHRGALERATIRVWDIAEGRDVATHAVNSTSAISWSPDGRTIAYSDLEYDGSFAIRSDIYLWRVGDRRERRITRGARVKHPAFTPDGRALIAVENRAGRNRVVEVDLETGAIAALVAPDDDTQFSEPQVHGGVIAVAEWNEGRIDVVTYSRGGERIANLTAALPRSTNAAPRFTIDGETIVFTSDVTGVPNVFAVATTGGEPRRLTNVYGGAFYPTTRDGRTIWFSDYHSEGFDLARADVGQEYPVTPRALPPSGPLVVARAKLPEAAPSYSAERYSPWPSLRPRWWSPVIMSEESGDQIDTTVGVTTAGGDVLGFHQYTATVAAEIDEVTGSANLEYALVYAYDRLYPTITAAAIRYDQDAVLFRTQSGRLIPFTTQNHRLLLQASAPWRRFDRQAQGWIGAVRDRIDGDPAGGITVGDLERAGVFRGTLQGLRVGAAFNNARRFGFSVSPENGIAARAEYENLSRTLGSDRTLQQVRGDLRGYLAIPYRRSPLGRHVVAARVAAGATTGERIIQRELRVGGVGLGGFLGVESRTFPVRGYSTGTLRGNRAALASVEYRLPIWHIDRGPSTWPLFFNRVVGDVFVDAGSAWDRGGDRRSIASAGAELALDIYIGYFVPLRYRAGVAYLLRDPGRGDVQPYIALESSF